MTAALALYLLAFLAFYLLSGPATRTRTVVTDAFYLPVDVFALVLAVRAARSRLLPPWSRHVWLWMAAAYVARTFGDGVWFWLEGVRQVAPFPSTADVGYLAFYPLLLVAVLRVPTRRRVGRDRVRLACELLAVVGAGWMALWALVIGPIVGLHDPLDLTLALEIAYPLCDLGLVAAVASIALRGPVRLARPVFLPLALSLACYIVADTTFAAASLQGTWVGGQVSDLFWIAAIAFAAWAPARQLAVARVSATEGARAEDVDRGAVGTAGYTYGAVLVGAVLLWWAAGGHPLSALGGLLTGLTLVLTGVLVRQVLAVKDADGAAAALSEQQRVLERERSALAGALRSNVELTAGLEATVQERTAELAARTRELHRQAYLDPLTGLGNRLLLRERLEAEASVDGPVALLMVDLDGFKEVNDSLGHSTGDALLVAVAERLRLAAGDALVVRLGGDEFALLWHGSQVGAHALGQRLVDALVPAFPVAGGQLTVGASVGVAGGSGQAADPEVLLRDADCAMYHAKRAGKGRVATFEQGMHDAVAGRLLLQEELRRAVGTPQVFLHYQPLVDPVSGRTLGAEALVRWDHPDRGLLPPLLFVPLAEDCGLIVPLGEQVLRGACAAAARWQALPGGAGIGVSVNVSLRQVTDPGLLETVRDALRTSGLPASLLTVEITESVLAHDERAARAFLTGLRALGVRTALDDFGTGHSSLASLGRYPLDVLKLDKSFADDLVVNPAARRVAAAVVEMGRALGLRTCMEGVEDAAQAAVVRELGCEVAQGYLWDRPLPEVRLLARLAAEALTGVRRGAA